MVYKHKDLKEQSVAFHGVLGKAFPSSMITMFSNSFKKPNSSICFTVVREVNNQSLADNAIRSRSFA